MNDIALSPKFLAFMKCNCDVEFLEGTTAAGKTTVGVIKFILKCFASTRKLHIISAEDLGVIEKNIINKELGILEVFDPLIEYHASGKGQHTLPHIEIVGSDKVIYLLGYGNKAKWKKALGGQYGCLYIDEINTADMDFVREISMRSDYFMGTLNPDDPNLPIYKEFINRSRPLNEWLEDYPEELLKQVTSEPLKPNWIHWYFTFNDNHGISLQKKEQIKSMAPIGTKLYRNKILGLRGRSEGLVFNLRKENIIKDVKGIKFKIFSCGVDTSYSRKSDDTISFIFTGITHDNVKYALAEEVYNNTTRVSNGLTALAPSDIAPLLVAFLDKCRRLYGLSRDVFIDSADSATLTECEKFKRIHGVIYNFLPAYKKTQIIDRITLQQGWMAEGQHCYFIHESCKYLISELNSYSWKADKQQPEDANDHCINADQYSWLPYKHEIGRRKTDEDKR